MNLIQLVLSGIALGCVYGLVALGFVLIYKATETVTFAQGEVMMLGAFACYVLISAGAPFWIAAVFAVGAVAVLGAIFERVVLRPVLGAPQFTVVMLTIGAAYVMRGGIAMIPVIGTETHTLQTPYTSDVWRFGGLVLGAEQGVVIGMTAALCLILFVIFRFTRVGLAMQASSQNQLAAYYMGIPVKRLNSLVWALASGVAALAGLLLAPITFVHVNMGFIGLKAFPAAVIGGFGSLPGALVGGLIIGIAESLAGFYLPEGMKDVAAYILVLVLLVVKPHGLFGGTTRKKV